MSPAIWLPISPDSGFQGTDDYVNSLLSFVTSDDLFQKLCGGVHILDFLTREPDLYTSIIPQSWREWFEQRSISDVLDLLLKEDIAVIESMNNVAYSKHMAESTCDMKWRDGSSPPCSLVDYILSIRKHSLRRKCTGSRGFRNSRDSHNSSGNFNELPRRVAVGMKAKKIHEVENFLGYINGLAADVEKSSSHCITHIVDFGSGQNYLGRAMASEPSRKSVIALESKVHNITGAKAMDITAKLAEKERIIRNKKQHQSGLSEHKHGQTLTRDTRCCANVLENSDPSTKACAAVDPNSMKGGSIQYIETLITNGDLSNVITQIQFSSKADAGPERVHPTLMIISLHSCGNLSHHALRSIVLNPDVKVVAIIGCCYNLVTERLGPPTYKIPSLRSSNLRLDQTSNAFDPHGFPMSDRMASYQHKYGRGVRFNITARMMAVQAPNNWTSTECESFFTRHFYRAMLQRILIDSGIVGPPVDSDNEESSPRGWSGAGPALTIGSLRKSCYTSFIAYVRGAIAKLEADLQRGREISDRLGGLSDQEIMRYEERYRDKKKELSIIWSLMAFSATVVESTIVVDRWLYLKEQKEVKECWVEAVFDYEQSPRNLAIVGIKH